MVDITTNERANHAQFVERFLNEIMWWKNYKTFECYDRLLSSKLSR